MINETSSKVKEKNDLNDFSFLKPIIFRTRPTEQTCISP